MVPHWYSTAVFDYRSTMVLSEATKERPTRGCAGLYQMTRSTMRGTRSWCSSRCCSQSRRSHRQCESPWSSTESRSESSDCYSTKLRSSSTSSRPWICSTRTGYLTRPMTAMIRTYSMIDWPRRRVVSGATPPRGEIAAACICGSLRSGFADTDLSVCLSQNSTSDMPQRQFPIFTYSTVPVW